MSKYLWKRGDVIVRKWKQGLQEHFLILETSDNSGWYKAYFVEHGGEHVLVHLEDFSNKNRENSSYTCYKLGSTDEIQSRNDSQDVSCE